jgi:type I restriction enzyme S subunit
METTMKEQNLNDWKEVKLQDICIKMQSGGTPKADNKKYYGGVIPFTKIDDITKSGKYLISTSNTITEEGLNNSSAWKVPKNSILYSMYASLGFLSINKIEVATNQAILNIIPNEELCKLEYLYYALLDYKKEISKYVSQSTQKNLNAQKVRNFKLNLPSLQEQERIAEILSNVDNQIEKTQEIIAKSEEIKQGLMQELLIKGIGHKEFKEVEIGPIKYSIPKTWNILKIEEASTLKGRIGWQGLTTKEYLDEGDYYLITGTDFKDGKIIWETCHYVEKERYEQDKYIQLQEKDIYVTKDGTIGKVAFVDKSPEKPATLNSGVFVLRPLNNSYLPEYMYWVLQSFQFKNFIEGIKAGSTISHLYQRDFNNFKFISPPLQEQEQIANILSNVDNDITK